MSYCKDCDLVRAQRPLGNQRSIFIQLGVAIPNSGSKHVVEFPEPSGHRYRCERSAVWSKAMCESKLRGIYCRIDETGLALFDG
jgi:hypothetical protein